MSYEPRLPIPPTGDDYLKRLYLQLTAVIRELGGYIELLATGTLTGTRNATTAVPTTGTYATGDFVKKSNPVEAGSAGSKYIIIGWICTASGTPGTWKEARVLTGN